MYAFDFQGIIESMNMQKSEENGYTLILYDRKVL
jgi:hypothetical protein